MLIFVLERKNKENYKFCRFWLLNYCSELSTLFPNKYPDLAIYGGFLLHKQIFCLCNKKYLLSNIPDINRTRPKSYDRNKHYKRPSSPATFTNFTGDWLDTWGGGAKLSWKGVCWFEAVTAIGVSSGGQSGCLLSCQRYIKHIRSYFLFSYTSYITTFFACPNEFR